MMRREIKNLCVFCGSSSGSNSLYLESAKELGRVMSHHKTNLVYGGGGVGIMGALATTVKEGSQRVIGVIPNKIFEMVKHINHDEDELIIVPDMHKRKQKMYELSDAFVALPGGVGTLEEFVEILTWLQLGYHTKPIGLLNTNNYYSLLIDFFTHMVTEGFLKERLLSTLIVESDATVLLERLSSVEIALEAKISSH